MSDRKCSPQKTGHDIRYKLRILADHWLYSEPATARVSYPYRVCCVFFVRHSIVVNPPPVSNPRMYLSGQNLLLTETGI
jgi:hypothetical protein